jgi:DNA helicase II / ATP-dependent DNA helicase PcrA
VHRVKGQEWPLVVVHQADADQFPHRLSVDTEEERRVFHVAITRASERLHIVPDGTPSPFIDELTTEPSVAPRRATAAPKAAAPPKQGRPGQQLAGADAALFESLKELRRHLAAGKPAYTVLADKALADIVSVRPSSRAELSRISGIGPAKLDRYGDALLRVVAESGSG